MKTKAGFAPVCFATANDLALQAFPSLLAEWLPDGRRWGQEWVALNPRRNDRRPGSFKINVTTGAWADFAIGERGGDPVSLCAYLFGLSQSETARAILNRWGNDGTVCRTAAPQGRQARRAICLSRCRWKRGRHRQSV